MDTHILIPIKELKEKIKKCNTKQLSSVGYALQFLLNNSEKIEVHDSIIDIPFKDKRIQFKGLNNEQIECLLKISEYYITSQKT